MCSRAFQQFFFHATCWMEMPECIHQQNKDTMQYCFARCCIERLKTTVAFKVSSKYFPKPFENVTQTSLMNVLLLKRVSIYSLKIKTSFTGHITLIV